MCYSALVNQHIKQMNLVYKARVQIDLFEDLFKRRLGDPKIKINKGLERQFMDGASVADLRIQKYILEFRRRSSEEMRLEIKKQTERLSRAEKKLLVKPTKGAYEDQRIAAEKIRILSARVHNLSSEGTSWDDHRIYPGYFTPIVCEIDGELSIVPSRYSLPLQQSYNVRKESLKRVPYWKELYGRKHAIVEFEGFYEGAWFASSQGKLFQVPCLFDNTQERDYFQNSFASITVQAEELIQLNGQTRMPKSLTGETAKQWLKNGQAIHDYDRLLGEPSVHTLRINHEITSETVAPSG